MYALQDVLLVDLVRQPVSLFVLLPLSGVAAERLYTETASTFSQLCLKLQLFYFPHYSQLTHTSQSVMLAGS